MEQFDICIGLGRERKRETHVDPFLSGPEMAYGILPVRHNDSYRNMSRVGRIQVVVSSRGGRPESAGR